MKKIYPLNNDASLKENIKSILPMMFDDFFSLKGEVVNFPMRKNVLHEMRIQGKPLRYAMEIGEYCFGDEFKKNLTELKDVIELMGEIHDADVLIPDLNLHIKEIRLFNRTIRDPKQRFSTLGARTMAEQEKFKRREMYAELCKRLNQWQNADFKERLTSSLTD